MVGSRPARARPRPPKPNPQASRLAARVDVALLLPTQSEPVTIQGLEPYSLKWTRNRPAVPDTCDVELSSRHLPFDPDILVGAHINTWLYEHDAPELCAYADAGHFGGVVQDWTLDENEGAVRLSGIDFTHFPLRHQLTKADIRSVDLRTSPKLWQVVDLLISFVPGGESWKVIPVGSAVGDRDVRQAFSVTRRYTRAKTTASVPAPGPYSGSFSGDAIASVPAPEQTVAERVVERRSRWLAFFGAQKTTVWKAITDVCAFMGAIPEVGVGSDGGAVIHLIDALEYQTSSALRPFRRDGRPYRTLTEGETCDVNGQKRELVSGRKTADFVQITSTHPRTGEVISAVWPEAFEPKGGTFGRIRRGYSGLQQTVHGVTSKAKLKQLARASYIALKRRASSIGVTCFQSWSDGGAPDQWDADLLDLASGAAVRLNRIPIDVERRLRELQLSDRVIRPILNAYAQRDTSPAYQVDEVTIDWDASSGYEINASLRRFLAAQEQVE